MIAHGSAIAGAPPSRAPLARKPVPHRRPVLFTRPQHSRARSMMIARATNANESSSSTSTSTSAAPAARIGLASAAAAVLVGALALVPPPASAADPVEASAIASLFAGKCAGCHAGGGNLLQASATLRTQDLERNGYADPEALYALIYGGKGRMPGFGADCSPKGACTFGARLTDGEVRGLADFVLRRAGEGWAAEGAPP